MSNAVWNEIKYIKITLKGRKIHILIGLWIFEIQMSATTEICCLSTI